MINDLDFRKTRLMEHYNFFIVLYLKNFKKFNSNRHLISNKKFKNLKNNQNHKTVSSLLKKKIYLIFMSSLSAKEAVLKLSKLNIPKKNLNHVVSILIECCIQEDKYLKYYSQIAEIFCKISKNLKKLFEIAFLETCKTIFRYKIIKIKISGNFFGYLFSTGSLSWNYLANIIATILVFNIYLSIVIQA